MARIRTIKPEFQDSESMGRVSRDARLTFILLWPRADDAGRMRAHPTLLARALFPYDSDGPELIGKWLTELEHEGCLVRYESDGKQYLAISNWQHQKIDHPSASRLPPPPEKKTVITKRKLREPTVEVPRNRTEASPLYLVPSTIVPSTKDCSEPEKASEPVASPIIELPTNKTDESYAITAKHVDEFRKLYPAVNVEQELRAMRGWLIGNPTKRKTHRGMLAFVTRWLAKAQDRGGTGLAPQANPDKARRELMEGLDTYGLTGRWIPNIGNGLWKDVHGVGPPPHESDTRVTETDLDRFPKARAMRDKLRGSP